MIIKKKIKIDTIQSNLMLSKRYKYPKVVKKACIRAYGEEVLPLINFVKDNSYFHLREKASRAPFYLDNSLLTYFSNIDEEILPGEYKYFEGSIEILE